MFSNNAKPMLLSLCTITYFAVPLACATSIESKEMNVSALEVKQELASSRDYTTRLSFVNQSSQSCEVDAFELRWEGAKPKRIEPRPRFSIAPKERIWRDVSVGYLEDVSAFKRSLAVTVYCVGK